MDREKDAIVVVFGREQVGQRRLAHFLKRFGPAALPEGAELAAMMDSFQFLVEGWDDDPQEIYAIPEVRKFYQHFHGVWPYWFYFCNLDTETLKMMTFCMLPNLKGFKRIGEPKAAVEYDPLEMLAFIKGNFVPLNTMMERAGLGETDIYNRTRDLFLYFGLPYEVEPPA